MRRWSDEEIYCGLREADRRREAFRQLHLQYGPALLGFLAKRCRGDRELAEDLLGRTLTKAYGGLVRMERPCRSLPAWLYTVAARTALDEFARGSAADPLHEALPLDEERVDGSSACGESPARENGELDAAVEQVLARLDEESPRYRTLLEMEHVGACDRGEIAEATGIPRKQIAQYLKRARERFGQLAREYPVLAALAEGREQ